MTSMLRAIGPKAILGESPLWDGRGDHLTWVDINGRAVHRWHAQSERTESIALQDRPGSIALTSDPDTLVLASEHRIGLLRWTSEQVDWKVVLPIEHSTVRLNDGRVGPSGDFWVGSMHVPATERRFLGSIYRIHPDWTWDVAVTEVGVANALTPVADGMLWADTLHRSCWTISEASGASPTVSGTGSPWAAFGPLGLPGGPDGACTDADGNVWIACVHGAALACLDPSGRVLEIVDLPVRRPTCPVFGGPGLRTLFVTTIGGGGNYPVFEDEPEAGRVLCLDVGRAGVPEPHFDPMP